MSTICPCGSTTSYADCCEPFLEGRMLPDTAEKLMRSRYTAFTLADVSYLKKTLAPESRRDFDAKSTEKWAKDSKWKGLSIISTKLGAPGDSKGTVEFIAKYELNGEVLEHHETAQFRKTAEGLWYFVDGHSHTHKEGEGHNHTHVETYVRSEPKIGRNDPCHCGSGKKFKKCHGSV